MFFHKSYSIIIFTVLAIVGSSLASVMTVDIQYSSDVSSTHLTQAGGSSTIKIIVRDKNTQSLISGANINCTGGWPGYSDNKTLNHVSGFAETSPGIYELNVDDDYIWAQFGPVFMHIGKARFVFEITRSGYESLTASNSTFVVDRLEQFVSVPDNYWIMSETVEPDSKKIINYNGVSYTCYKMNFYAPDAVNYKQQTRWLLVGPNGIVSNGALYSKITIAAEIDEWQVDSLADALDIIADNYEGIVFWSNVTAVGQSIRDTAAGLMGGVVRDIFVPTGGTGIKLLTETSKTLARGFLENRISAVEDPLGWYRNSIKLQLYGYAELLRNASLQIRSRGAAWDPHEAEFFWQNCSEGLIMGLPLCNAMVQALPETDLASQLADILVETAKGADPTNGVLLVGHAILTDLQNLPEKHRIYAECHQEVEQLENDFKELRSSSWSFPSDLVQYYQNNPLFNIPLELAFNGPWAANMGHAYNISGNVTQQGIPVANAEVSVYLNGSKMASLKTDQDGNFSAGLNAPSAAGSYSISLKAKSGGYSLASDVSSSLTVIDPVEGYDLAVYEIENDLQVNEGSDFEVNAKVANYGDHTNSGTLSCWIEDGNRNIVCGKQYKSIGNISPGFAVNYNIFNFTAPNENGSYNIISEIVPQIGDEDYSNNIRTSRIFIGDEVDINGYEGVQFEVKANELPKSMTFGSNPAYTVKVTEFGYNSGGRFVRVDITRDDGDNIDSGELLHLEDFEAYDNDRCSLYLYSFVVGDGTEIATLHLGALPSNFVATPGNQEIIRGTDALFVLNKPTSTSLNNAEVILGWGDAGHIDAGNSGNNPDSNGNIQFVVNTDNMSPGTYQWFVKVSSGSHDALKFYYQKLKLTVLPIPVHDLAVESLHLQEEREYRIGENIAIDAVLNRAEDHTELANLKLTATDAFGNSKIVDNALVTVNGQVLVSFDWNTDLLAEGTYTLRLNGTIAGDSNPDNNTSVCTVSLKGVRTIYVDASNANDIDGNGSAEHPFDSIQEAINTSYNGDTVIVRPGRYIENINFNNKDITLTTIDPDSSAIRSRTVIDAGGSGSSVTFGGSETDKCLLTGFSITGGSAVNGGGILGNSTNAKISFCHIKGNTASGNGGGIFDVNSTVQNCILSGNTAKLGGGAFCDLVKTYFINNTIVGNKADEGAGIYYTGEDQIKIENCIFENNKGEAVAKKRIDSKFIVELGHNHGLAFYEFPNLSFGYGNFDFWDIDHGGWADLGVIGESSCSIITSLNDNGYSAKLSASGQGQSIPPWEEGSLHLMSDYHSGISRSIKLPYDIDWQLSFDYTAKTEDLGTCQFSLNGTVYNIPDTLSVASRVFDFSGNQINIGFEARSNPVPDDYDWHDNSAELIIGSIKISPKDMTQIPGAVTEVFYEEINLTNWQYNAGDSGLGHASYDPVTDILSLSAEIFMWEDGTPDYGWAYATKTLASPLEMQGDFEFSLDYNASTGDYYHGLPISLNAGDNYQVHIQDIANANGGHTIHEDDIYLEIDGLWHHIDIPLDSIDTNFGVAAVLDTTDSVDWTELKIKNLSLKEKRTITYFDYTSVKFVREGFWNDNGTPEYSFDDTWFEGDYHLLPESPCIDAGNTSSDYSNEPIPNGGRVNIGAYGNTPEATKSRGELEFMGYQILSEIRVGRTSYEYEIAVKLRNNSTVDLTNIFLSLIDATEMVTTVGDDVIVIERIPAGQSLTSTDTFKVIIDRMTPLETGRMTWELVYYDTDQPMTQIMVASLSMQVDDSVLGDITGEGEVNMLDFAILASQWMSAPGTPSADISDPADGVVDILDLAVLAENWLE